MEMESTRIVPANGKTGVCWRPARIVRPVKGYESGKKATE